MSNIFPLREGSLNRLPVLFGIIFVFCLILFYLAPYTRDDWAWGSSIGIERLLDMFADYNGRYGGNITEILLTNFRWLKALISASITLVIIFLMIPIKGNTVFSVLLATSLILIEPVSMFNQTLVYTAAFSNYVIPTAFMLFFIRYFSIYIEEDIQEKKIKKNNPGTVAIITLLSFLSCIFIEHITLYLVFGGFILNAFLFYKHRNIFPSAAAFFIGTAGGAALMFSNGAYWNVMSGVDKYRSLGAAESENIYMEKIGNVLFSENWFFNIVFCMTVFLLIYKNRNRLKKTTIAFGCSVSACFISFIILVTAIDEIAIFPDTQILRFLFEGIPATILYAICIIGCLITVILCTTDTKIRRKIIFLSLSVLIVNAPLIVVNPVSPRCFFPTYVLFIMIILQCISQLEIKDKWSIPLSGIVAVSMFFLIMIYAPIFKADNERLHKIRDDVAKGRKIVTIADLPNEDYVWGGTPISGTKWEYRYKKFYDIPEYVTLLNEE